MLVKPCAKCGVIIPYGQGRCPKCESERKAERDEASRSAASRYADKRDRGREHHFYKSKDWRTLSAAYRASKGHRCEACGGIATDCHHKKPIDTPAGWIARLETSSLMALCVKCHNKEHGRTFGAAEAPKAQGRSGF